MASPDLSIDTGVTAWMCVPHARATLRSASSAQPAHAHHPTTPCRLVATLLVQFMTPALALFYGGFVSEKVSTANAWEA